MATRALPCQPLSPLGLVLCMFWTFLLLAFNLIEQEYLTSCQMGVLPDLSPESQWSAESLLTSCLLSRSFILVILRFPACCVHATVSVFFFPIKLLLSFAYVPGDAPVASEAANEGTWATVMEYYLT